MSGKIVIIWTKGDGMERSQKFDKEKIIAKNSMILGGDQLEIEKVTDSEKIRDETNARLLNRKLLIDRKVNPFMKNNNYVEDLDNQEKFLRPQNSDYET